MEGESRRSFMKEIGAASALAAGGFLNRNPHNKGVNSYLKKEYCNSYQLSIGRSADIKKLCMCWRKHYEIHVFPAYRSSGTMFIR